MRKKTQNIHRSVPASGTEYIYIYGGIFVFVLCQAHSFIIAATVVVHALVFMHARGEMGGWGGGWGRGMVRGGEG